MNTLCQIRDIYRAIYEFEIKLQQSHNMCLNEGMLLCILSEQRYSSNELAGLLGLSKSNTSKVIKSVESKGLIERIVGTDDKRQMYFILTQSGHKKLESVKCGELDVPELLTSMIK
ncbi:winged helix DNA-binding protein [Dysgonomonas sp. 216]|uniref:winged helix DNA-binding protein n=1 Tax=Dysgonomonas sp. 216 TaxID=2302934 RepID=UPI0016266CE2